MVPREDQPEVIEEYHEAPHYHRVVATGIFGGLTPDRSGLLFDLALHTRPVPKAITYEMYEVQPGIMLKGREVTRVPRDTNTILIERQIGVFIPGREIRSIANWLMAKADEWEAMAEREQTR